MTDCAWSEQNEFHLVSSCADGSIKLWDLVASAKDGFALRHYHEHAQDASSVSWNPTSKDCFLSGSWDTTVKLWRPELPASVTTFVGHAHSVFAVEWNVYQPTVFASCSGGCLTAERLLRPLRPLPAAAGGCLVHTHKSRPGCRRGFCAVETCW